MPPSLVTDVAAKDRPVYSLDMRTIFDDLAADQHPAMEHWELQNFADASTIQGAVEILLRNVVELLHFAEEHPTSNAGQLVEHLRMGERFFVPRKDHMELFRGIIYVCDGFTSGTEVPSWDTRLIVGPKGIGKSLLLKVITVGVALSLGPKKTIADRDCRVLAGYCPRPARGELLLPTQLAYRVLRQHGLAGRQEESIWGWCPRDGNEAAGCAIGMCRWLRRNNVRLLLILDEFDEVYKRREGSAYVDQLTALRESSLPVMIWLSGSAGSLRMLVYGDAGGEPSRNPDDMTAFERKYPGYWGINLNSTKFRVSQLRNTLRLFQSARIFVHNPVVRLSLREHHSRVVRFVEEHGDEERREQRAEGVLSASIFPPLNETSDTTGGDGATGTGDDREEGEVRRANMLTVSRRLPERDSQSVSAANAEDSEVRQWLRVMYWNSCGLGRHYEQLTSISDENGSMAELRRDISSSPRLRALVIELATRVETAVPEVLNPMKAFDIDPARLLFPLSEVVGALRERGAARDPSPHEIAEWADVPYLFVEGSRAAYVIGFAHPAYAAVGILCKREELRGLMSMEHLAFMFPVGHLGQGFPERMALEAMANAGVQTAITRAKEYGSHSGGGPFPENMQFSFLDNTTIDLGDPSSWDGVVMRRIQEGEALVIPLTKQQYAADAAAFWSTVDGAGAIVRHIALVQVKLVCLYDSDLPYDRRRDHSSLRLGEICVKLHSAWLDWCGDLCRALGCEEAEVIPWFIVVTSNKVTNKKRASKTLSRRSPLSAAEMEKKRKRKEKNGKTMTDSEVRLANATISGVGCVLDQEDMYDAWPAKIKSLADLMGYWPEYMRPPAADVSAGEA